MRLTDRVYLVGSGSMGLDLTDPFDCHVYLLDGGSSLALIDVGAGMSVPKILQNVRDHGFAPDQIQHIVLTHVHADHSGGAAAMRAALQSPKVYLHKDAARFLRNGDEAAISLPAAKQAGIYPTDYRFEPCPVDVEMDEGATLRIGDLELRVLSTPGHCVGHTSFVMDHGGRRYFFSGDLVFFGGKILLQNIWDCDLQAYIRSLRKVRELGVDVFLPGHLTFSLRDGQRHIDAANKILDGLLPPPNFTYGW